MNGQNGVGWVPWISRSVLACGLAGWMAAWLGGGTPVAAQGWDDDRPSTSGHVRELAEYLDEVQISEPVIHRGLAVYPIILRDGDQLPRGWLTMDRAISRGDLEIREKGSGSVPLVVAENRGRDNIFIMAGEVISGGKQARTVRNDVVLTPGQRIELDVFCVEAHRWEGGGGFSGGGGLLPQSIQLELRIGADQSRMWAEVARNNAALGAENATGSLGGALSSKPVQDKLVEVRQAIVPRLPDGTMGFIFVDSGRALGAEFFGREELARDLLPKLLDSYAVDYILLRKGGGRGGEGPIRRDDAAIEYFKRISRAGSQRSDTPGAGRGIRTRGGGLLGDGVSFDGDLVHYGVQIRDRLVPLPRDSAPRGLH